MKFLYLSLALCVTTASIYFTMLLCLHNKEIINGCVACTLCESLLHTTHFGCMYCRYFYRHLNKIESEIHLSDIKIFHFHRKGNILSPLQRPASLMLCREVITYYFEYNSKHINTFCGSNVVFVVILQLTVAISLQVFRISSSVLFSPCRNGSTAPAKFLSRCFDLTPIMLLAWVHARY
jgi:hypothetical protein